MITTKITMSKNNRSLGFDILYFKNEITYFVLIFWRSGPKNFLFRVQPSTIQISVDNESWVPNGNLATMMVIFVTMNPVCTVNWIYAVNWIYSADEHSMLSTIPVLYVYGIKLDKLFQIHKTIDDLHFFGFETPNRHCCSYKARVDCRRAKSK